MKLSHVTTAIFVSASAILSGQAQAQTISLNPQTLIMNFAAGENWLAKSLRPPPDRFRRSRRPLRPPWPLHLLHPPLSLHRLPLWLLRLRRLPRQILYWRQRLWTCRRSSAGRKSARTPSASRDASSKITETNTFAACRNSTAKFPNALVASGRLAAASLPR